MAQNLEAFNKAVLMFASVPTMEEKKTHFLPLGKAKGKDALLNSQLFREALDHIFDTARSNQSSEQLEAIALLMRISGSINIKKIRNEILFKISGLKPGVLKSPLELMDKDDKEYIGKALCLIEGEWIPEYAASFIANEGQAEKARYAMAVALLKHSSLSDSLMLLKKYSKEVTFHTENQSVSRARRATRIIDALRGAFIEADPETGNAFGEEYASFLMGCVRARELEDREAASQFAQAALDFQYLVMRQNFSLSTQPESWAALSKIKALFTPSDWPESLAPDLEKLSRIVVEALLLLAQQGIGDDVLRAIAIDLLGDIKGKVILGELSNKPGISDDMRRWLAIGQAKRKRFATQDALEETVLASFDRELAEAFRQSIDLIRVTSQLTDDIHEAVSISNSRLSAPVKRMFARINSVCRRVETMGKLRHFRLRGTVGEITEYSPEDHESFDVPMGVRTVRIKAPLVERNVSGRPPETIIKADVDIE